MKKIGLHKKRMNEGKYEFCYEEVNAVPCEGDFFTLDKQDELFQVQLIIYSLKNDNTNAQHPVAEVYAIQMDKDKILKAVKPNTSM